ncbi:MAG TPA: SusD/RagB family nutrient-binding outer membrane lipoprotein [Bacteroidales bacterium]|nr:SusD/RagB family nutrient-binding outer membrane lipoprotein [Bacteroidales bacterium]
MKNTKIYIGILSAIVLLLFVSCGKFEEYNTNPDATTVVPASMECTNIVLSTLLPGGDAMSFISTNALPKYVGFTILGKNSAQYNNTGSGGFGGMTLLPNIEAMLSSAQGGVMENSYKGIASFAKAYSFYHMTMWMGDIPYSEAGKGADGLFEPKYDTQEQVLISILDELKAADQYFAEGVKFTGDPTPYEGDPVKWRKAVNAFTLKVLMSLSPKENTASLDIKNRFKSIVEAGNIMDAGTGYFGLAYSTQNKHPLSASTMFVPKTIVSSLLINHLKTLNDRRLFYYCEPSLAQLSAGKVQTDPAAYVGVDVSMDYDQMNLDFKDNKFSALNLRYLKEDACEPRMMMTSAEQQLILAEAVVRGWINGTAKTYYEDGVKAALADIMATKSSYAHARPINQAYIDGYFTGEAAFKSTAEDQLKQIWLQEYILRFMQDADFSYFEYRRNKYPEFPINPASSLNVNNTSAIPMRCLYPGSESNYNRSNLTEALNRQYEGYDEINKLMWLLK